MAVMASPLSDALISHESKIENEINGKLLNGHTEAPLNDVSMLEGSILNGKVEPDNVVEHSTSSAREDPLPLLDSKLTSIVDTADKMDISQDESEIKPVHDQEQIKQSSPTPINLVAPPAQPSEAAVQASNTPSVPTSTSLATETVEIKPLIASIEPSDSPVSGQIRRREDETESQDDDYGDDEPLAKRTKVEDVEMTIDVSTEIPATTTDMTKSEPISLNTPASSTTPLENAVSASNAVQTHITPSTPITLPNSFDKNAMTKLQGRLAIDALRRTKKIKDARAFLLPVDPVAMNLPTYLDVVTHPMDIGTMEEKMKAEKYANVDEVWQDFSLMVDNCIKFNGTAHAISAQGMNLRQYFAKLLSGLPTGAAAHEEPKKAKPPPTAPIRQIPVRRESARVVKSPIAAKPPPTPKEPVSTPTEKPKLDAFGAPLIRRESQVDRPKREIVKPMKDLPYTASKPKKKNNSLDLQFCELVNKELFKPKWKALMAPFSQAVDPVALNIPNYHRVIKKPMDFGTITTKLENGAYKDANQYHSDSKLVFQNCYTFNQPGEFVHQLGKELEKEFDELWSKKAEWIDENSSDVESEEADDEGEPVVDPAARLMEIQRKIAALSAEAMSITAAPLQKPTKKKKKEKGGISERPKKRTSLPGATKANKVKNTKKQRKLSLDEKRYVSEAIGTLDDANMRKAVQIIRNGVPSLKDVHDDEIELDVDEIPDEVLKELYTFVRAVKKAAGHESASDDDYEESRHDFSSAPRQKKKNKPMSAQEQEDKIAQVQQQLGLFQPGGQQLYDENADTSEEDSPSSSEEE